MVKAYIPLLGKQKIILAGKITVSGDVYIGTYKNNAKDGYGGYTMKDGTRYKGEFKNGLPSGHGTYVFENGDIYVGEFVDDEFHGAGSWSRYSQKSNKW